jgi:hypothetical protein
MGNRWDIRVGGHLEAAWSRWFMGLTVTPLPGGMTSLHGVLADQAALYGVLDRLRDLNLPLVSLTSQAIPDDNPPEHPAEHDTL